MRLLLVLALLLTCFAALAHAQVTPTAAEAQAFYDAYEQTAQHTASQYLIAYSLLTVLGAAFFLLLNLRTLSYLCFIGYGTLILNTPYYIPDSPKFIFGFCIIFVGVIGILTRLLHLGKLSTTAPRPPQP